MQFRQVFDVSVLLYIFLCHKTWTCFSAPIENENLYFANCTSNLRKETTRSLCGSKWQRSDAEIMDNGTKVMSLSNVGRQENAGDSKEFKKLGEPPEEPLHLIRVPLFISKAESNSFLSRKRRSSTPSKVKDTGTLPFSQTQHYKEFQYIFPPKATWWPDDDKKGREATQMCIHPKKSNGYCTFKEVYKLFYKKMWDKGGRRPWTYELTNAVFRYSICQQGPMAAHQTTYCPRPCSRPRVCTGPHMTGRCVETGARVTKNYECRCEEGYFYDKDTGRCRDRDLCGTDSSKCVPYHTLQCEEDDGLAHNCICKPEWMGERCEEPFNACRINDDPCGQHGRCEPTLGTPKWNCDCYKGWGDDTDQPGADCNRQEHPCDDLICANSGECIRQGNSRTARCSCTGPWEGATCEDRKPEWNPWFLWSVCTVTCGMGGLRERTRTCDTQAPDRSCVGQTREQAVCSGPLCLVNGEWGPWMRTTDCSNNCGGGRYLRSRNCEYDSDDPDAYGEACQGEQLSYEDCNTMTCPKQVKRKTMVDIESLALSILQETGIAEGDWGAWNSWTACSESCGQGFQQRGRMCLNSLGTCEGDSEEFQDCYEVEHCETENEFLPWSSWSVWSACSPMTPTCTRTRHCPYGANDPVYSRACDGESDDEAPCRFAACTGEAPATLVDVANVMGGDAAMQVQMGNMRAAGIPPNSYLNAAAPAFVAAAPVVMAPMGYPQNMNGHGAPHHAGHKPKYETETKAAGGSFGSLLFLAILIGCGCYIKKKFGDSAGGAGGSGYETKSRLTGNDY